MSVISGTRFCQIDANGCATDGTGRHGNGEYCTVRVAVAGLLTATQFRTESCCDYVTIGGNSYRGSTGPSNVVVAAGSNFTWRTDHSVTNEGWTICLTPVYRPPAPMSTPRPPTRSPTRSPTPQPPVPHGVSHPWRASVRITWSGGPLVSCGARAGFRCADRSFCHVCAGRCIMVHRKTLERDLGYEVLPD